VRELVFLSPRKLEWRDTDVPQIVNETDAIVEPIASTICDLDGMIIRGETPFQGPFAIGHECVAKVVSIGEGVKTVSVGDIVVVNWHISCGLCVTCSDGRPNACRTHLPGAMFGLPGLGDWGGTFSDLVKVVNADFSLTVVPSGINPVAIASAADNLPFGFEFTVPHLRKYPGAEVLIMGGCGSIALYAVMFAKAGGSSAVYYYDTNRHRLELATNLGAHVVEGPAPHSAGSFQIVVDASANENSLLCAVRSADAEGIVSSVGGHFRDVAMPLFKMYRRGVNFYTGRGRGGPNVAEVLTWVADGRVDPSSITSELADFDDAPTVLENPSLKPVFLRSLC
jgi:threonine dehydrogenase-like Zn-dependent dehydrogenase